LRKRPSRTRHGNQTSRTGAWPTAATNWLDDHSRLLLSCTALKPATGHDVVTTFLAAIDERGTPASTLTDNGRIYTARFGGGRNTFAYLLPLLGVRQKNGSPGHPQTQGKIERFHQTSRKRVEEERGRFRGAGMTSFSCGTSVTVNCWETICMTATRARDMGHPNASAAIAAAGVTDVPRHERPISRDICREASHSRACFADSQIVRS
jgi:transposase InsO family protein